MLSYLEDDIWSLVQSTEVCRLWWLEGHHRVWRKIQLRDLIGYKKDLSRRQYFASLVEEIYVQPGDTTLASERLSLQLLDFSRLSSVYLLRSNLEGVRKDNIMSLIVPSLRSWAMDHEDEATGGPQKADDMTTFGALLTGCSSLTALHVEPYCHDSIAPVVWKILDVITAIECLSFGDIAETLHGIYHAEDLLRKLLCNKPKLATVSFSHGVDFSEQDVDSFLARMGSNWSIPSLRQFGRPAFIFGPAAVKLLECMPNLEHLIFTVEDRTGTMSNSMERVFAFMPTLRNLRSLQIVFSGAGYDFNGSWLAQLGTLKALETLFLDFYLPGVVSITGTQLASFLTSLPKLKDLSLHLGTVVVSCSAEEDIALLTLRP